jgi:hypothetical protein
VLVVTYTNYSYPDGPYPKTYHIPDGVYIWVSAQGEVQGICPASKVGTRLRGAGHEFA